MKASAEKFQYLILRQSPFIELNYERSYSLSSLVLIFFTFSHIGWIWEVLLHMIEDGMFINRGIMTGPWLPIYGFGGVLVLTLLKKWRKSPMQTILMIMLLCGIIEYVTSLSLEYLFGAKWWDYSDILFNLQGRVCLEGLLIFGIGGLVFVYIGAPKFDNWISRFKTSTKMGISLFLLVIFFCDLLRTVVAPNMGIGITN